MPLLGTAGKNGNFAPAFTVPGTFTLHGYVVGGPGATRWYRSIDIKTPIPAGKVAALRAAMTAQGITRYRLLPGGPYPWITNPQQFSGFRLFLSPPSQATAWTAAAVTTALAALETAILT
jgi:hypothetical protein